MTEERNQLAELFAACWKDDAEAAFHKRSQGSPGRIRHACADGMDVKVVRMTTAHITMPMTLTDIHSLMKNLPLRVVHMEYMTPVNRGIELQLN